MHFLLGNTDAPDHTKLYLAVVVVLIVAWMVFWLFKHGHLSWFRFKGNKTEIEMGSTPKANPSTPVTGQTSGPNSPGVVMGDVNFNQTGVPHDIVQHIIDEAKSKQSDLQQQLSNAQSEVEQLKQKQLIAEAVQRVENEADKGDKQARSAIEEVRDSGDTEKLQAILISVADQQTSQIKANITDHIQLNREIAEIAYLRGDLHEALARIEAILKFESSNIDAINKLGQVNKTLGELDKAEQAFIRVGEMAGDDLSVQAIAYGNLGVIYYSRGQFDKAVNMYTKALKLHEQLGQQTGAASQYDNLGIVYDACDDLDKAELMYRKAIDLDENNQRIEGLANEYSNLGLVHLKRGDFLEAEKMFRNALDMDIKLKRKIGIARDYGNLGLVYKYRKDYKNAEKMFKKSLNLSKESNFIEMTANQFGNLGNLAILKNDVALARAYWEESLTRYERIGMPHMIEKVKSGLDGLPDGSPE